MDPSHQIETKFVRTLLTSKILDQTLFIKEVLNSPNKDVTITQMRRAGKSLNLDMLDRFLVINLDSDKKTILNEEELKKCRNYKLFEGGELE